MSAENKGYSDYVIYVDESGDHGLTSVNPHYPIFVLVFCIFKKSDYMKHVCPLVQDIKFNFFGHDSVILHSSDIRKSRGDFKFLFDESIKDKFLTALSAMIKKIKFSVIPTIVDKNELKKRHIEPENPYEIALRSCIEGAYNFLQENSQHKKLTHIVIEKRGRQEDSDLELAFRRIVQGDNFKKEDFFGLDLPFEMVFADKKVNSSGLQIADLVAHPIGSKFIGAKQEHHAYDIVETKFYKGKKGLEVLP